MADKMEQWETENGFRITADNGLKYIADCYPYLEGAARPRLWEAKANIELIVALHNSAVSINPSNPRAVAEGMGGIIERARAVISASKYMQIEAGHKEEGIEALNGLIMELAKIGEKRD